MVWKLKKMIQKHGEVITSFAMLAAAMASSGCRSVLYEPKEPEGIEKLKKPEGINEKGWYVTHIYAYDRSGNMLNSAGVHVKL